MARKNEHASFEDYTHDLRSELRSWGKQELGGLEAVIQGNGYMWMQGYLQNILENTASGSRLPITELLKTPSRHTAKKTRTVTTAAKDRTAKVNLANSKLLGSPIAKSTTSRPPLSPLGGRSLNSASAPSFQLSPAKSPAGKSAPPAVGKADKGKGKAVAKKGKAKKNPDGENAIPEETSGSTRSATSAQTPASARSDGMLGGKSLAPSRQASPAPTPPRPPRSSERAPPPVSVSLVPQTEVEETGDAEMQEAAEVAPELEAEVIEEEDNNEGGMEVIIEQPAPISASAPSRPRTVDLSIIAEAEEDRTSITIPILPDVGPAPTPVGHSTTEKAEPTSSAPAQAELPTELPTAGADHSLPSSSLSTSQPAPPLPARQVRSSWLSKALATGTNPGAAGAPGPAGPHRVSENTNRASLVGGPTVRLSTTDYPAMRKSLVQPGMLAKRKSGEGIWDEEEEEDKEADKRPGKIARVESEYLPLASNPDALPKPLTTTTFTPAEPVIAAPKPIFDRQHSQESFSRPATTAPPRSAAPPSSSVDRVNKALDDMRERQQAKDAAKQKAALSVSIAAPVSAPARSTGTGAGFLYGLGTSLGRSLGLGVGTARDPEEEAKRAQQDKEEEEEVRRKAKEDLSVIMRKMEQPEMDDEEPEEEEEEDMDVEEEADPARPTFQLGDEEEDELDTDEEAEVNESIEIDEVTSLLGSPVRPTTISIPESLPSVPVRNTGTPSRLLRNAVQSTTPQGTPPRSHPVATAVAGSQRILRSSPATVHPPARAPRQLDGTVTSSSTAMQDRIKMFNGTSQTSAAPAQTSKPPFLFSPTKGGAKKSDAIEVDFESPQQPKAKSNARQPVSPDTAEEEEEAEDEDEEMAPRPASTMSRTTSSASLATSLFGQASTMANKALGVKPAVGLVKSVQLAGSAYKKDLAASERRAQVKEQRVKNIADRKAEEEKKQKEREVEEKRLKQVELERRRKEAEERRVQISKAKAEKAEKERKEREAAEKAEAEAEALRKHKLASSQNRPVPMQPAKRVISASSSSTNILLAKMKEPVKLTKSTAGNGSTHGGSKLVPSTFRTAPIPPETPVNQMSHTTSIRLVGQSSQSQMHQQTTVVQGQAERKPLGPPTRPSAIRASNQAQAIRQSAAVASQHQVNHPSSSGMPSHTLTQSRLALQSQLEAEASEDIVLPDIASEYSDSGDETDDSPAFKRPQWAESPELRAALAAQASKNPDELFGPIRPLLMDELFKAQAKNKFRSRTSSGNWQRDGLKKEEEEEYARRMGFTSGTGKW